MNWNKRFLRESGRVDHTKLSPCTGDKDCSSCAHFDELIEVQDKGSKGKPAKPLSPAQKKHNEKMKEMKDRHQKVRK